MGEDGCLRLPVSAALGVLLALLTLGCTGVLPALPTAGCRCGVLVQLPEDELAGGSISHLKNLQPFMYCSQAKNIRPKSLACKSGITQTTSGPYITGCCEYSHFRRRLQRGWGVVGPPSLALCSLNTFAATFAGRHSSGRRARLHDCCPNLHGAVSHSFQRTPSHTPGLHAYVRSAWSRTHRPLRLSLRALRERCGILARLERALVETLLRFRAVGAHKELLCVGASDPVGTSGTGRCWSELKKCGLPVGRREEREWAGRWAGGGVNGAVTCCTAAHAGTEARRRNASIGRTGTAAACWPSGTSRKTALRPALPCSARTTCSRRPWKMPLHVHRPERPHHDHGANPVALRPMTAVIPIDGGRDAKQHATHLHAVPQLQLGGASVGRCASACESGIRAFNAGGVRVGERGHGVRVGECGHGVPVGEPGGVGWTEPDGDARAGEVERDAGCDEGVGLLPRKGSVDSGGLWRCPGGCENLSVWWGSNASTA